MSTEDRLAELIRQRALLMEHLQWLDREIARASGATPVPSQPLAPPPGTIAPPDQGNALKNLPPVIGAEPAVTASLPVAAPTVSLLTSAATAAPAPPPAAVIGDSRVKDIRSEARSGCLLWVTIGIVVFVAAVAAMIFFGSQMRPEKPEDPKQPEKTGSLILPLAERDARA